MADFVVLARERPHQADAGQVFLQAGRQRPLGFVGDLELRPDLREEVVRAGDDERHQHEREPGEPGVSDEQDGRHHGEQQHRASDLHDLGRQEDTHGLDIGTAALHEVAGVGLVEEHGRKVMQTREQGLPQAAGERLGGNGGPTALEELAASAEAGECDAGDGGDHQVGDIGFAAEYIGQTVGRSHEDSGTEREVLVVYDVQHVAAHQGHGEHEGAGEAGGHDGGGVPQALAGG